MNRVSRALACVGVALLTFAFWGLETAAGRRQFDEMAGIIPFAGAIVGLVCLVVSVLICLIRRRHRGRSDARES